MCIYACDTDQFNVQHALLHWHNVSKSHWPKCSAIKLNIQKSVLLMLNKWIFRIITKHIMCCYFSLFYLMLYCWFCVIRCNYNGPSEWIAIHWDTNTCTEHSLRNVHWAIGWKKKVVHERCGSGCERGKRAEKNIVELSDISNSIDLYNLFTNKSDDANEANSLNKFPNAVEMVKFDKWINIIKVEWCELDGVADTVVLCGQ